MGEMRMDTALKGLQFVGQAEGDRLTYYVYRGSNGFVSAAPNGRGGATVNFVEAEVPDVIESRFSGQRVTANALAEKGRRPDLFGSPFAPLNSLYVMVALRKAHKLKKREGRSIVFKIH